MHLGCAGSDETGSVKIISNCISVQLVDISSVARESDANSEQAGPGRTDHDGMYQPLVVLSLSLPWAAHSKKTR